MTTAHLLCKRDHALLHWLLLHWLLLHLRRGASKPLPRLRVRPRPQWCRQTMMMPRGRSGGREDAAVRPGVAIIRKHEPSVTRRRAHRLAAVLSAKTLPVCRIRPNL